MWPPLPGQAELQEQLRELAIVTHKDGGGVCTQMPCARARQRVVNTYTTRACLPYTTRSPKRQPRARPHTVRRQREGGRCWESVHTHG
jgi:hypothetical protein